MQLSICNVAQYKVCVAPAAAPGVREGGSERVRARRERERERKDRSKRE